MAAAAGNSAVEQQLPLRIVQHNVTGSFRAESFRNFAIGILVHNDARNGRSAVAQPAVHPRLRKFVRLEKENVRDNFALALRHELVQLLETGPRASALRMSEHQQRVVSGIERQRNSSGPLLRSRAGTS